MSKLRTLHCIYINSGITHSFTLQLLAKPTRGGVRSPRCIETRRYLYWSVATRGAVKSGISTRILPLQLIANETGWTGETLG